MTSCFKCDTWRDEPVNNLVKDKLYIYHRIILFNMSSEAQMAKELLSSNEAQKMYLCIRQYTTKDKIGPNISYSS